MDWKSITIIGMDTNKDKTYSGNLREIKEDWNEKRIREFFSIAEKRI